MAQVTLQRVTEFFGPVSQTCDVVTHMDDCRRPRCQREERIEGRDAIRLGRGNVQTSADVVEGALADPAHTGVGRVKRRKQEMAATFHVQVVRPCAKRCIDGGAFVLSGDGVGYEMEIHSECPAAVHQLGRL
jgi:hypothetical protein